MIENINNKIKEAVLFLKDGQSCKINDLRLEKGDMNCINVIGWSQYSYIENITKESALTELKEVENAFNNIVNISIDLREFILDKEIVFKLYFDDYGKASIGICFKRNNKIVWNTLLG